MEKYDILTIGGGPAGITIAKILGKKRKVGIIRPEEHSMIYCAMPYVIEGLIPVEKTLKQDRLVTDTGSDLIRGKVRRVSFEKKTVALEDGNIFGYDKLVIATGADPILPPIPGSDLEGVFTFKTRRDLDRLLEAVHGRRSPTAVVVGAGAIGIELAQALRLAGVESHLVDVAPRVLPNLLDAQMAEEPAEELLRLGVRLHLHRKVLAIRGESGIESVVLERGEEIRFDSEGIVVFAVGVKANTSLFQETHLEIGVQGIGVNGRMETNIPDVFAVGDCAQFRSGITGETVPGKLATNAVPMARILARNLLGDNRSYPGFYNGAATKVGKYFVGGTGFTEASLSGNTRAISGHAQMTTTFPVLPDAKPMRMKLICDADTLRVLGGQVVAQVPVADKVDLITLSIQNGLTARDLAMFSYSAQPHQSFFPANNPVVACAEDILARLETGPEERKSA